MFDGMGELELRDELTRQQELARRTINRGIVTLAVIPIVLVAALAFVSAIDTLGGLLVSLALAGLYTLISGLVGLGMITSGGVTLRRLNKELRAIDEPHQLPVARVVDRR
jgi:predicted Co/Zn/Cd cation transporter (cation efflux family)